ncbi:YXWGXW repeat-containing protein [Ramlibacter sp. AN1133]|uniref:YXWGXW repeat-containing protein n=1 Tax=Ramlibacter sp. AN1133 TaxID=3133429 RepID=UPI0030C2348B
MLDQILCPCPFEEIDMKHNKLIAALATAGSLFAVSSAHAFAPAVAAGIAALIGAGAGSAANQAEQARAEQARADQARAAAAAPSNPTVVLGGPPAVIQAGGYRWQQGHFEVQNGVSAWVPGHWVSSEVVIHEGN